ncbi:iron-containing alcohol dehydrogenase [Clostridium sp. PL3]|uniref:Iron-containing alcohol dehydrogenase n=1 Tax=Clostridium thailandense TaxID=2794346 RepID=A0A949TWP3_9CLOT|nr:iron-containing alcohol dehydrogenase [Clostridium thailandense]MBV7271799.1 iron-containing alcohol dehydrogenase [Clostridium thailandense]
MSCFIFQSPVKVIYGIDSTRAVGKEAANYGKKAMLVTGRNSSKKTGALSKVVDSLKENNLEVLIFDEVESDPSVKTVRKGTEKAKEQGVDFIVALGGGSALDAAKGISAMCTNAGDITDYEKITLTKMGLPVIAIPTTAGTGSEISKFTIITDTERKIKMLIGGEAIIPKVAILDPSLTIMMPKNVTAATGMDALTHAIEAYISRASQPMTEMYALKAIEIISKNLPKAVLDGENIEARQNMLIGQMYAGFAFSNASVALVHAMARPLGAYFDVAHGLANALLLPKVMEFNRPACKEKLVKVAIAMGEKVDGLSENEGSFAAVKAINNLFLETGLPKALKEVGVLKESIKDLARDALESGSVLFNPRKPSLEEIINIYEKIY